MPAMTDSYRPLRQIGNSEIGRILHCKSEIRNFELDAVRFQISDFGFAMQDSSNFKISNLIYAVMIAVTVARYATCSYASSISLMGTIVVASDFASN